MTWLLPLESSRRWDGFRSPFALHARRRWLDQAGPEFAIMVARDTEDLEKDLYRISGALTHEGGEPSAATITRVCTTLYAFHLIWRVPTPLVLELVGTLRALDAAASPEARTRYGETLETSPVLPFPPGAPDQLLPAVVTWLEGLFPAKRGRAALAKAVIRTQAELPPATSVAALAHRFQAATAHATQDPGFTPLLRQLPAGQLEPPVLIPLMNAVSGIKHTLARSWCETHREALGSALPETGTQWGDPLARDAFLIEQTARRLEWVEKSDSARAPAA